MDAGGGGGWREDVVGGRGREDVVGGRRGEDVGEGGEDGGGGDEGVAEGAAVDVAVWVSGGGEERGRGKGEKWRRKGGGYGFT